MYFAYPAIIEKREKDFLVHFVDLEIEPFVIDRADQDKLVEIIWEKAARFVQNLLLSGKAVPRGTKLEDLPIGDPLDRDAVLIELTC